MRRYPIVGKRWQCLECLERVGFDLCAVCFERRADVVGRFNQHHKAGAWRPVHSAACSVFKGADCPASLLACQMS